MSFSALSFVFIFLPVAIIPYLILSNVQKGKARDILLLIVNMGFYIFSGLDTFLAFVFIILLTYMLGNLIYLTQKRRSEEKKWILLAILMASLTLAFFKLNHVFVGLVERIGFKSHSIAAPIGISFLIFESISYVVDIYRKEATPGSFLDAMLFLSLFPKLISGPIVQWKDFQPQIPCRRSTIESISEGVDRIIVGYAKKVIVADTFASMISTINNGISTTGIDTQTLWLKYVFFFFQIYYDFSGYSDIAIGLCKIYGFSIKENFNFPYISRSISEFWRRWHISLGSWFREYIYIPLGGNRRGNVYFNLLTVFVLTGIWHGTELPFLLWGLLNGIIVVIERIIRERSWYKKIPEVFKWTVTIVMLFFFWILFSEETLRSFGHTLVKMFTINNDEMLNFTWEYYLTNKAVILLIIAIIGSIMGAFRENRYLISLRNRTSVFVIRKIFLVLLFAVDVIYMVNRSYSPFMYFRF